MPSASTITIAAEDRAALARELEAVWEATFGQPAGDFTGDLEQLEGWFGPRAQSKTLRAKLRQLEPVTVGGTLGGRYAELLCRYGDRAVVTPEGRWVLESLRAQSASGEVRVDLFAPDLVKSYRDWAHSNFKKVVLGWEGKRASTQPPALGLAAVVLMVTCAQRSRAMKDPKRLSQSAKDRLKDLVRSFVAAIGKESGLKEDIAGHPLSVASERFFGLRRDGGLIWFEPGELDMTIDTFVADLSSKGVESREAMDAFYALIKGYEEAASVFDGAELPRVDKRLTADILDRLRQAFDSAASQQV